MLRAGETGFVKIGKATDVESRRRQLQMASVEPLVVLRIIPGDLPTEAWLHRKFASLRRRGEWFEFTEAMMTITPPSEAELAALVAIPFPPAPRPAEYRGRPGRPQPSRISDKHRELNARIGSELRHWVAFMLRLGFARFGDPAAEIARLAGVNRRSAENWLQAKNNMNAANVINLAANDRFMGSFFVDFLPGVVHRATERDIRIGDAIRELHPGVAESFDRMRAGQRPSA